MKRIIILSLLVALTSLIINAQGQKSISLSGKQFVPGRVLIKLKAKPNIYDSKQLRKSTEAQNLFQKIGSVAQEAVFSDKSSTSEQQRIREEIGLDRWVMVTVPAVTDMETLISRLRRDPNVEIAEPDYIEKMDAVPNDPRYSEQQHLPQIKAEQAWDIAKGDSTVIIAIIDSGVDWDHPDLASVIWNNPGETGIDGLGRDKRTNGVDDDGNGFIDDWHGWDFVDGIAAGSGTTGPDPNDDLMTEDNDPMDYNGHGTHCAGIAGAATDNNIGIASISWGCKIMPLRVGVRYLDGTGVVYMSFVARAYQYAADNGASVANQSSGSSGQAIVDAALYAFKRGVVICNSAGNGNDESGGILSAQPWVLKVASVNDLDRKASYSTYGTWVNISAPGGDQSGGRPGILSTIVNPSPFYSNNLYVQFQGTSMASPLVAGLAGLVKSRFKTMDAGSVVLQICATADNIDGLNTAYAGKLGYGRINAERAVTSIAPAMNPDFSLYSFTLSDASGNNNGKVDPGETIELTVYLKNNWDDATNTVATLSTTDWGINITKSSATFGSIPGIRDVDNSTKGNVSDKFVFTVGSDSIPRNVTMKISVATGQGYTKDFNITFSILPSLLFIDDDDGAVNVEQYYTNAFSNVGLVCDTWDRSVEGPLTASKLSSYKTVVWGCEWAFPSLDSSDRAAIGGFLDNGGQLFLSGQDIGWDLCATDNVDNQYFASGGASKTWYEKYLKTQYQADNAGTTTLTGMTGDPIGDGLNFSFTEPLRTSVQQFPDVITPLSGATSVFLYPNSTVGATRYSSTTCKVVYFSFGGFEAITDPAMRTGIMDRIYKWFNGFQLQHTPLKDTESPDSQRVQAQILSASNIESVNLYWDTDGSFPFNKKLMRGLGAGIYEAYIPGQSDKTVQYTIIVRTANGYMPYSMNSFKVGTDVTPPYFLAADSLWSTLGLGGIYSANVQADDNIIIDTNGTYIIYKVNGSSLDSVKLKYSAPNNFNGTFDIHSLVSNLYIKDSISYYYTIHDASSRHNGNRLPAAGFYTFQIGRQLIDNFEKVRPIWNLGLSWGYESSNRNSIPTIAMSDSPPANTAYLPNIENTLTLTQAFDLSSYTAARMYFWRAMSIHTSDTLYVEYQKDAGDWTTVRKMNGTFPPTWKKDSVDLPGSSNTTSIRFRLKTDGATQSNGILLDDIEVVGGTPITNVEQSEVPNIPKEFSLRQNYPNPFNPSTVIEYQLPAKNMVSLKVFDILGREVITLVDKHQEAGIYQITFNGANLPSGIYLYRLQSGTFTETKKLVLLK